MHEHTGGWLAALATVANGPVYRGKLSGEAMTDYGPECPRRPAWSGPGMEQR
jgi:hypothetical protein